MSLVRTFVMTAALLGLATAARADDDRTADLERKVEALTRTVETLQLGGAADTAARVSRFGLAPAAAKVYGAARGTSVGGYGEMLFEKPDRTRQDGRLSGGTDRIDFLRAVFYVGHKFTDDLLFNSEIEWEHSGIADEAEVEVDPSSGEGEAELSGEVVIEFAYLDWRLRPSVGVRAGKLLVPMGFINEMHEPPVFFGARRPEVERVILPSTWAANGAGFYGETGGLSWRAYVMEGLDASGFRASNSIRGGRQDGSQSIATHPAFVGRADWSHPSGWGIGGAAFTGDSWQGLQSGPTQHARTTLVEGHARVNWRGFEARGVFARGALDNAGRLSDAAGLTGTERLGDRFWGGYADVAYDVMPLMDAGTRFALIPYARIEELDTQEQGLPPGGEDPALHVKILTVGAAFKPHPEVVVKMDRQQVRNDARTATGQWNVALGYLF